MPTNTVHLADHLDTLTREHLMSLRQRLPGFDASHPPMNKVDLIADLTAALLDPRRLREIWNAFDDTLQDTVRMTLEDPATPGMLDTRIYMILHGIPPQRLIAVPGKRSNTVVNVASPLALFFDADFRIPVDFANALRRMLGISTAPDAARKLSVPTMPEPPKIEKYHNHSGFERELNVTRVETEPHAFHDLLATLRIIEAGKIKVNARSLMPAQAALKTLNSALSLREYEGTEAADDLRIASSIRTFGLLRIVIDAGWAAADQTGRLMPTADGTAFMQQPTPQALRHGFVRWLRNDAFDEILRIDALHGAANAMMQQGTPPSRRRIPIANALRAMPGDCWIDVEVFFRMVLASGNDFDVESSRRSMIWVGSEMNWSNQPIGYCDSEAYWRIVKCQLVLALLFEPLACFGMVDVAYLPPRSGMYHRGLRGASMVGPVVSHYDVLRYIRVTPLGHYLLGSSEQYAGPVLSSGPTLRVLPNQQIIITSRMAGMKAGHPVLSKFCDQVSDDVYQLAPMKLLKTLEKQEMSVADMIAYLERESNAALPQTVRIALEDLSKRSSAIREVGPALLFHVGDAHLALELEHDRALQRAGCRRSGDWIVVPADKAAAFRRRARELGYAVQSAE